MKRTWWLFGVVVVAIVFFALVFTQRKTGESEAIKIGAILPLTGKVSIFGQWIKDGIDLATEDVLKKKGIKIEVYYEDSKFDAKTGVLAFNKLISTQHVPIVLSAMSRVSIPLIPLAEKHKVVLFLQDVTYPNVTERSSWVFRHFIQSDKEAEILAGYALDTLRLKTFSVLYINDEAGLGAARSFKQIVELKNGKISVIEPYSSPEDIQTALVKIISTGPQAIYIFGNGPLWAISLKKLKELGYTGVVLTNTAMYIPNFRDLAGKESIEGVYFTYPFIDTTYESAKYFHHLYREKYNNDPPIEAAYAWDIIHIIANASYKSGGNWCEKLMAVRKFSGAFGELEILANRDIYTKIAIGIIKSGKVKTIAVYTPE